MGKPAFIITTFPNSNTEGYATRPTPVMESETAFNRILSELVQKAASPKVLLIHGYDVLDDTNGLSGDLIHPTTYGHAVMGLNLASILKRELLRLGYKV